MFAYRRWMNPWALWYAVALHIVWGIALLVGGRLPTEATPVAALWYVVPNPQLLVAVLFGASIAATLALVKGGPLEYRLPWGLLLGPQAVLMLISGMGSVTAAVTHHYADGLVRPFWFIFSDQAPIIVGAVVHSLAIVNHFGTGLHHADA